MIYKRMKGRAGGKEYECDAPLLYIYLKSLLYILNFAWRWNLKNFEILR